jgi:restriction endonuclease S subunit
LSSKTWKKRKLKDLCEITRGGSPRPIQAYLTQEKGMNWIKIGDAVPDAKYIEKTNEKITFAGAEKSRVVYPGDFVLSNSMSFGRPYILRIDGCIHDGWLVLSNISNEVSQDYLYHVLSSGFVKKQFSEAASGAIVQNLNIEKVEKTSIPLPTKKEQNEIVASIETRIKNMAMVKRVLEEQSQYINALSASILHKAFRGEV